MMCSGYDMAVKIRNTVPVATFTRKNMWKYEAAEVREGRRG